MWLSGVLAFDSGSAALSISIAVMLLTLAGFWLAIVRDRNQQRQYEEVQAEAQKEDKARDLETCQEEKRALETALDISDQKYVRLLMRIDAEGDK